jgi:hypothetical protein
MLLAGVAVFAIRLHHAGPYAMPGGGNLRAGVLSLLLGAWLASGFFERDRVGRGLRWLALAASPVVFFFALYATLAELEEVVTLRARDSVGHTANLRLWIVDDDGTSWVRMPRSKADEHGLDDVRVQMLRQGEDRCVHVTREPDRDRKAEVNRRTYEKYRVMQLATAVGLFETGDNPNQVVLRLDPCSGVGPADD